MDDLRERLNVSSIAEDQISGMRRSEDEEVAGSSEGLYSKQSDMIGAPLIDGIGLQKALEGLSNMALAHEIALDKDFKLKKPDRFAEPLSPELKEALDEKEKYWEKVNKILVNKDIKECKPTVLELIDTLKTMLYGTLLPHNVKMKEKIDQELELEKLTKQIDNDAFDFVHFMTFILDSLAALCCPIRDQEVAEIRNIEIPSQQVRKTIELMENMNLDMANFIIDQSRRHIVLNCVFYERNKFTTFIEMQCRTGVDPLERTREWILRHTLPERDFKEAMAHAFLEILEWEDDLGPETLTLDWSRFPKIRREIRRVTVIGAMVASVYEFARLQCTNDYETDRANVFKNFTLHTKLRDELNLLITREEVIDPKKLEEALERCCMQAVKVVNEHKASIGCEQLSTADEGKINGLIRPLLDLNHPVRVLYYRRVKEWFFELAKEEGKGKMQTPLNLALVSSLLAEPVTNMLRVTIYNRRVFDILYIEIFHGNCPPPTRNPPPVSCHEAVEISIAGSKVGPPLDPGMVNLIAKLQGNAVEPLDSGQPSYDPSPIDSPRISDYN